jgi:hypothetical protein
MPVIEEPAAEGMVLLQLKPNNSSDLWLLENNKCHPRKTSHAIDDIFFAAANSQRSSIVMSGFEAWVLAQHTETFRTVSIRIAGVYDGVRDEYWNSRCFVPITYCVPLIDNNHVLNVADALVVVSERLIKGTHHVGGKFYYYTYGERSPSEAEHIQNMQRFYVRIPLWLVHTTFYLLRRPPSDPYYDLVRLLG